MKRITYSLTEEVKQQIIADFTNKLNTGLDNPAVNYSLKLNYPDDLKEEPKAKLYITTTAYARMMMYVRDTDTEIAWHGTAFRLGEGTTQPLTANFLIREVFLYPQIIRATTVDTDQEKYNEWKTSLDDVTFNNLNFQGHSHVNMAVRPSNIDEAYYETILNIYKTERPDSFYIFTIMNKRGEMYLIIYDLAKNIVYNKEDIELYILDPNNTDVIAEIKEQKQQYCEAPTYNTGRPTTPNYIPPKTHTTFNQDFFDPDDTDEYIVDSYRDKLLNKYAQDCPTETDEIFDDLDKKYKNIHLASKKQHKKKKK